MTCAFFYCTSTILSSTLIPIHKIIDENWQTDVALLYVLLYWAVFQTIHLLNSWGAWYLLISTFTDFDFFLDVCRILLETYHGDSFLIALRFRWWRTANETSKSLNIWSQAEKSIFTFSPMYSCNFQQYFSLFAHFWIKVFLSLHQTSFAVSFTLLEWMLWWMMFMTRGSFLIIIGVQVAWVTHHSGHTSLIEWIIEKCKKTKYTFS